MMILSTGKDLFDPGGFHKEIYQLTSKVQTVSAFIEISAISVERALCVGPQSLRMHPTEILKWVLTGPLSLVGAFPLRLEKFWGNQCLVIVFVEVVMERN